MILRHETAVPGAAADHWARLTGRGFDGCSYHRILHRDLMEMAGFIDSMYGVYSNISTSSYGVSKSTVRTSDY